MNTHNKKRATKISVISNDNKYIHSITNVPVNTKKKRKNI